MYCSIILPFTRLYCPHCYCYHYWYCYCHRVIPVIKITWIFINLNNNIIEQLTSGLGKLMEKTTSVFWVILRYWLCNRDMVPLQGFKGWLTSCIVSIVIIIDYLAVGPGSTLGHWAVVSGMYRIHLKHGEGIFLSVPII